MKKTTVMKAVTGILLLAVSLPLFSALNIATPVSAVTVVPPIPYAMEQYGQHHSGIYKVSSESAPAIDGTLDDGYTLMDSFDAESGNFNGVFVSASQDGSQPYELASEFCPKEMTVYGAYDENYLYFYVQSVTRATDLGYELTAKVGFNFNETTQSAAQEGTSFSFALNGEEEKSSGTSFVKTEYKETVSDSSSTEPYDLNRTVYEYKLAWADIAPDGNVPETDFDRVYLSLVLDFFDLASNSTQYWVYGVPNNAVFLESENMQVGAAFALNGEGTTAAFTPNVVDLLGSAGEFTTAPLMNVTRKSQNGDERTFDASLTLEGVDAQDVKEAGIIFAPDASSVGAKNLTWTENGENVISTTEKDDADTTSYTVSFTTAAENYNQYFSIRPFVIYEDDTLVYGDYYSNTPAYYDDNYVEYTRYMNVLMIGCSFSNYYLDELVSMAKESGIHMTAVRSYKSAAQAYEHWTWLLDDYHRLTRRIVRPTQTGVSNVVQELSFSYNDILSYLDWDVISVQDHYGIEMSHEDGYELCMNSTMPYLPNLFRYLDVNYPDADLYLNETWAFEVGYGYTHDDTLTVEHTYDEETGYITGSTVTSGSTSKEEAARMECYEQQVQHYQNIKNTCYYLSESVSVPMIPCGDAWQLARYSPVIDDNLCARGSRSDGYHDGEEGGGQYLNACVWYEMLIGDCRENTWRPTSYSLTEDQVKVIQEAAHEAVAQYKTTQSYTGATINND